MNLDKMNLDDWLDANVGSKARQDQNGTQPPPRSPYMMGLGAAAPGSRRID